jgi:DMSO/TMAO reductase YedYZ molybdopterin-dependent catalytic subunit
VSTIDEFYSVDINSATPVVSAVDWSLRVTGAVEEPVGLAYDELRAGEAEHRYVTLRCIGEDLNGDALDTAVWTGIPVSTLLDEASPQGEYVTVQAADGYYATYPIEFLDGALLAYGMNGELLPREHGYPARLLLPGSWGKLNVKWVTEIEVTDTKATGWWEERGWKGESPMNTVAKLWAVNRLDDGRVELGGHAYAGTRGIETVEVSIDGGDSWTAAELAAPLPGEDVARQWRYAFEPQHEHKVVVRATDETGQVQKRERSDPFPTGATGWVRKTIES